MEPITTENIGFAMCGIVSRGGEQDDEVVVTGGSQGNQAFNCAYRLKLCTLPETKAWEKLPPLNVSRKDHASCSIGRQVYVFCGTAGDGRIMLNSIEVLDLHSKIQLEN
jgi:hypothetical protein